MADSGGQGQHGTTATGATPGTATGGAPGAAPGTQPDIPAIQQIALQEVQQLMLATSNLVTTLSALIASALGFVAALAWNTAIQAWLPTVKFLDVQDPLTKKFVYAGAVTLFAVAVIAVLSVVNKRLKGKNLLKMLP